MSHETRKPPRARHRVPRKALVTVRLEDEAAVVALAARQQGMVSRAAAARRRVRRAHDRAAGRGGLARRACSTASTGSGRSPGRGAPRWRRCWRVVLGRRWPRGSSLHVWELRDNGGRVEVVDPGGGCHRGASARIARAAAGRRCGRASRDARHHAGAHGHRPCRRDASPRARTAHRGGAAARSAQLGRAPRRGGAITRSSRHPAAQSHPPQCRRALHSPARRPSDGCSS